MRQAVYQINQKIVLCYNFTNCLETTLPPFIIFTVYTPLGSVSTLSCSSLDALACMFFIRIPGPDITDIVSGSSSLSPRVEICKMLLTGTGLNFILKASFTTFCFAAERLLLTIDALVTVTVTGSDVAERPSSS